MLGANVEKLVLFGSANLNGTGNSLDKVLEGNAGANVLNGGGGSDIFYSFGGADTLTGGAGVKFIYTTQLPLAADADTITDFSLVDDLDLSG